MKEMTIEKMELIEGGNWQMVVICTGASFALGTITFGLGLLVGLGCALVSDVQ